MELEHIAFDTINPNPTINQNPNPYSTAVHFLVQKMTVLDIFTCVTLRHTPSHQNVVDHFPVSIDVSGRHRDVALGGPGCPPICC